VLEFEHRENPKILSAWAKHFCEHYCLDKAFDEARQETGLSRKQYLGNLFFRERTPPLGQAREPETSPKSLWRTI
jgi:hypothetical protein